MVWLGKRQRVDQESYRLIRQVSLFFVPRRERARENGVFLSLFSSSSLFEGSLVCNTQGKFIHENLEFRRSHNLFALWIPFILYVYQYSRYDTLFS
jgi:hypothetical protein